MKRCFKCEQTKPLDDYYRHPRMADGHLNKCIECTKADVRSHRQTSSRPREYDRARGKTTTRRAMWGPKMQRYRAENPEKYKAHSVLNTAVKKGLIVRQPCEICGDKGQAHHDDYSKPLEVRWLCALHHARHHAGYV